VAREKKRWGEGSYLLWKVQLVLRGRRKGEVKAKR
jgi:hypothetical protein